MCDVEKLFYTPEGKNHPIEGYLSDEAKKDCEILFVLREPNSGGYNEPSQEFWMRSISQGDKRKYRSYYLQVLGTLASKLLRPESIEEKFNPNESYLCEALFPCAFMNLYPFSGSGKKGEKFEKTIAILNNIRITSTDLIPESLKANDRDNYEKIAQNRYGIMRDITAEYIVTTPEIFIALAGESKADGNPHDVGFKLDNGICFCSAEFSGKKLLSYYHPRYTGVSYDSLHKIEYKH